MEQCPESSDQVSGGWAFKDPGSGRRGRRLAWASFKARAYPPPKTGVWGGLIPDKEASKFLGPLTFEGEAGEGVALAGDISPGEVFEKFRTEKVSEQPVVQPPPT